MLQHVATGGLLQRGGVLAGAAHGRRRNRLAGMGIQERGPFVPPGAFALWRDLQPFIRPDIRSVLA
jgi:hypothetical protein